MITRKPLFLSIVYTNVIYKKNDTISLWGGHRQCLWNS